MPAPPEPPQPPFTPDEEHREQLRSILKQAGQTGTNAEASALLEAISDNIKTYFRMAEEETAFRRSHDALRRIWMLTVRDHPPIGMIRARLANLPGPAQQFVERKAEALWPKLHGAAFSREGFDDWIGTAKKDELVNHARLFVSEGGKIIPGRNRPDGKKSRGHLEPLIFGTTRRIPKSANDEFATPKAETAGGRPKAQAADDLVMWLAYDWTLATDAPPKAGRGDKKPFGDLVHRVFDWIKLPNPDQALRRYFNAVRREKSRAVSIKLGPSRS